MRACDAALGAIEELALFPQHRFHYSYQQYHPLVHKLGVIRTLFHRADTIVTEYDDVKQEKAHLKSALRRCGYPRWSFHNALKAKDKPPADPPEPTAAAALGRRHDRVLLARPAALLQVRIQVVRPPLPTLFSNSTRDSFSNLHPREACAGRRGVAALSLH